MSSEYLVEVQDLKQYFPVKTGFMKNTYLKAVDGVSFAIRPGETLGLVGESGCGKTTWDEPCCVCMSRPEAKCFLTARGDQ